MCIYIYIYYVYIYIYILYVYIYIYIVYIYIYCMNIYIYCNSIYIYIYTLYVYIYIYNAHTFNIYIIYIVLYIHIYIYIHIYNFLWWNWMQFGMLEFDHFSGNHLWWPGPLGRSVPESYDIHHLTVVSGQHLQGICSVCKVFNYC